MNCFGKTGYLSRILFQQAHRLSHPPKQKEATQFFLT